MQKKKPAALQVKFLMKWTKSLVDRISSDKEMFQNTTRESTAQHFLFSLF